MPITDVALTNGNTVVIDDNSDHNRLAATLAQNGYITVNQIEVRDGTRSLITIMKENAITLKPNTTWEDEPA